MDPNSMLGAYLVGLVVGTLLGTIIMSVLIGRRVNSKPDDRQTKNTEQEVTP